VWADTKINSNENKVYRHAFHCLGFKNFYTFEDMGIFSEFINERVSNNDDLFTIIITSGSMAPEVIEIVKKDNSSGQRAQILLFTTNKNTN
tara:strand:+ start:247 stop:519 length:273 start_codon:yes stop_codon:yes gene_type:complete